MHSAWTRVGTIHALAWTTAGTLHALAWTRVRIRVVHFRVFALICTGLYSNQSYPRIDQDENGWILSMRWRGRGWVFFMHWPGREYASALCITPFVWGSEMTWF